MSPFDEFSKKRLSFWQFFRLVFLLFSLFLMGDAFYRWDGFKLYMSFSEFLPSFALALILWSILALLTAFLAWIAFKTVEWICNYSGLKIRIEHLLLYTGLFGMLVSSIWASKKHLWPDVHTSLQLKLSVAIVLLSIAMALAWLFRHKAEQWISALQERITPLIWLFGILTILSVPLVCYTAWSNGADKTIPKQFTQDILPKTERNHPNVLLLTFDSLTARNMSAYGYNRLTTPFIDKWVKTASLFTRTEAASNFTAPTTASLMTGKRVWTHRRYHHAKGAKPYKSDTENLALVLKENGYYNFAFTTNFIASVGALNISRSFDIAPSVSDLVSPATIGGFLETYLYSLFGDKFRVHNWLGQDDFVFNKILRKQGVVETEYPLDKVFNGFLEAVDNIPSRHFFAWIHVMPPHIPYLPPKPFAGSFNPSTELREGNIQLNIRDNEVRQYENNDLMYPQELKENIATLRDYYDEYIRYCDEQFGEFIKQLQKRSLYKNTVIILSSDHGESFEHNYFTHGKRHLYEQVTHIPLIIKEPGQTRGRVIHDLAEQIDIPATILSLADIGTPSWMEGRSLVPLLRDIRMEPRPAFALSYTNNSPEDPVLKGTIALWRDNFKLIHYLEKDRSLLYNLAEDPGEMNNLVATEPEIYRQMLGIIKENLGKANEKILAHE
jgi:arylsulfatase A-like enzyme